MKLAKREKYLSILIGCAVSAFLLFEILLFPFFDKRERIKRGIRIREKGTEEMVVLSSKYRNSEKGAKAIGRLLDKRRKGFTLFSFLEKEAGTAGVKDRIKYMKPSVAESAGRYKESMVEMKLEGITLNQLVGYLHRIESPENVIRIKRMSIKQNSKEKGYLDAIVQVLTLQ